MKSMKSKHKMIEVEAQNIDDMVAEFLEYHSRGEMVCTVFNGKTIYSDIVSIDSAYLDVTGKTKSEFEEFKRDEEKKIEDRMSDPNHPFHSLLNTDNK